MIEEGESVIRMIEEEPSVRERANIRRYQISHHNNKVTDNGRYISYMLIKLFYIPNQQPFTKKQLKQSFISAFSALEDRFKIHSNRVRIICEDTIQFHYSIDDDDEYYDQDTFDHFNTNEKLRNELIKNMHLFLEKRLQFRIDRKEVSLEIEVEYIDDHIHIWIKEDRQKYYIYGHQILDTFQNAGILDVEHISTSETIRHGKIGLKLVVKSPRLLQSGVSIYEWFAIHLIDDTVGSQNDILDLLLDDASADNGDSGNSGGSGDSGNSDDSGGSGNSDFTLTGITPTSITYASIGNKRSRDDDILNLLPDNATPTGITSADASIGNKRSRDDDMPPLAKDKSE